MASPPGKAALAGPARAFDPGRYEAFRFTRYEFDPERLEARLHYGLDDEIAFTETLRFPAAQAPRDATASSRLDAALWALHLVAGVSYYKAAVPPTIAVETRSPTRAGARFLRDLYVGGLAEFAWTNRLRIDDRVHFPAGGDAAAPAGALALPRRTAVPIGGGKDSIVTLEALRTGGEPVVTFAVGDARPIRATAERAGLPHVSVERLLPASLLELNAAGAYNGHVPITAIVSCIAYVAAILYGFDAIAMSNERSASAPNLDWDGLDVNHQYSKSLDFERAFRGFMRVEVVPEVEYFSLLRPASELAIARAFARSSRYDDAFTSCNSVFRRDPSRRGAGWCRNCPKCRFVFLIMAPFMEAERLTAIFGGNMLADLDQLPGFLALLGIDDHKPFECVGETDESLAAFGLLFEDDGWREQPVVRAVADRVGSRPLPRAADVLALSDEHCLPPRFEALARAYLGA